MSSFKYLLDEIINAKNIIMPSDKSKKTGRSNINYKARLEKKLCLSQEIPEPNFDISDCNLKRVPSNVYVLCKVFRKEALYLQKNNLSNLNNGSSLSNLKYIKLLDLSSNMFTKLPNDINELESLEVLKVNDNQLIELPETIGDLKNLLVLNLSNNNLNRLPDQIGYCSNLEILDLSHNEPLKRLPDSLGKIHSLRELHIDPTINYPPSEVCSKGVKHIILFLSKNVTEDFQFPSTSESKKAVPNYVGFEEKFELLEKLKLEKQNERLRVEEELREQNKKEVIMQEKLKDGKKKLLEDVKNREEAMDAELAKVQEKKNNDRISLLKLCQEEEKKFNEICAILNSRRNLNVEFSKKWEKERKEEEKKLFSLTTRTKDAERREILVSMEQTIKEEISKAQRDFADRRMLASQTLASEFSTLNEAHKYLMKKRWKNNAELMESLKRDEELQKSAVASLLEKSDSASWELAQKIAIVEAQLAELTRLELSKKKLETESQLTELSNSRIALTQILMELFKEQEQRKNALIGTLRKMEAMRESVKDSTTFWMDQYQKLLKSKCHEMVKFLETVHPKLVYELFLNGVFHYLPLLKDYVLSNEDLKKLNSTTLTKLGVTNSEDRKKILSALSSFLALEMPERNAPSAPTLETPSAPLLENAFGPTLSTASYLVPDECIVCFEEKPNVVFVPCGHICCCFKCFASIALCPLCRRPIETAHKKMGNS